jgi:hypothetical protein
MVRIDAGRSAAEIAAEVLARVEPLLGQARR